MNIRRMVLIHMGDSNFLVLCTLYPEPGASTDSATTASLSDH